MKTESNTVCLALVWSLAIVATGLSSSAMVYAQSYPTRPVRFVAPFPPGGTNDIVGRILAQQLSSRLGHQVIVDNRPGAGGIIGTDTVAKAQPDGYTLLVASGSFTATPALHKKMPYSVARDFVGVGGIADSPIVMTRNPGTPYRTLKELVDYAKANPEKVKYGSGGLGSTPHLSAALFQFVAGVRLLHVPYKGGGPSMAALAAGEVDVVINSMTTLLPFIEQGRIRAFAVCQPVRAKQLPDVPTVVEAGGPKFFTSHWVGIVAPSKTPSAVLATLESEIAKAMSAKEVQDRLSAVGANPYVGTQKTFHAFIQEESRRWERVIKDAKIEQE
jgi:tripartite-type tricarboxylate transporter receptor subunit TctC